MLPKNQPRKPNWPSRRGGGISLFPRGPWVAPGIRMNVRLGELFYDSLQRLCMGRRWLRVLSTPTPKENDGFLVFSFLKTNSSKPPSSRKDTQAYVICANPVTRQRKKAMSTQYFNEGLGRDTGKAGGPWPQQRGSHPRGNLE